MVGCFLGGDVGGSTGAAKATNSAAEDVGLDDLERFRLGIRKTHFMERAVNTGADCPRKWWSHHL